MQAARAAAGLDRGDYGGGGGGGGGGGVGGVGEAHGGCGGWCWIDVRVEIFGVRYLRSVKIEKSGMVMREFGGGVHPGCEPTRRRLLR